MHRRISKRARHTKAAFTLMELSIVVVIISVIAGGVTVGTSLVNNYKLMTIVSDAERFRSAAKNFKDQYQYWPGDFPRATAIWTATSSPACNAASGTASTTIVSTTCNGSGNGVVGATGVNDQELREQFFFWQHLNLSGYIPERFSGFSSSASGDNFISPAINVPRTGYNKNLGFSLRYDGSNFTTMDNTREMPAQGSYGHIFSWSRTGTGITSSLLITPADALKLDTKMDDSYPFSGNVIVEGRQTGNPNSVNGCTATNDYVNSTAAAANCSQLYRNFLEK